MAVVPPEDPNPPPPPVADYELLRQVGRGSYGDVWLARSVTGLYRAIKIVWRDRFPNAAPYEREFNGLSDFMRLNRREARQLALLHVGRDDERGFFFYAMELADDVVTGNQIDPSCYEPLTLKGLRDAQTHLPANQVLRYGIELAAGLVELHDAGLIHRDIKPSNIILVDGQPKLADIGLVSAEQNAMSFVGTEGFVPPEGPGSQTADVFSLGKVLYEVATGNDRNDFPRLPTNLSEREDRAEYLELNEIIIKAAAPNMAERYPDASALLDELRLLAAGKSVRRLRFAEAGVARARKWILVVAVIAFVAGAGALFERRRADVESAGRRAAEAQLADLTRRTLHDASLATAQRALETGNYGVAREALKRAIPPPGDPDLRGFEWHALYREAQGDPAEIIRESGDKVTRIEASADGRWVAIDQLSPAVEIYDQHSGEFVRTLEGIHRIAGFSPDGTRLIGTTPDYAIETWSIADGSPDNVTAKTGINRPLRVHSELPHILYFEDGQNDDDHRLGIWNFETGNEVVSWPVEKFSDEGLSVFMAASSTPDLAQVLLVTAENLSGARSQTFRRILMESGEIPTLRKASRITPIAISPSGEFYVSRRRSLVIESVKNPDIPATVLPYDPLSRMIIFHPTGKEFSFGGTDNRLVLVDPHSGKTIREFIGFKSQIDASAYASGTNHLWSVDRQGEIRRWDSELRPAPRNKANIDLAQGVQAGTVNISATSDRVAITDNSARLTILDLESLAPLWTKTGIIYVIQFGADELLTYTDDQQLVKISASDGGVTGSLDPFGPDRTVFTAVASPNGQLLLMFSHDEEVVLWNLTSSQEIARYSAEPLGRSLQEFLSIALTDDGQVISTDVRQQLLLWNAVDGSIERVVDVPSQPSRSNLSPHNDLIAIATSNGPPSIRSIPSLETVLTIDNGRRNGVDYTFHPTEPKVVTQFVRGSLNSIDLESGRLGPPLEFNVEANGSDLGAQVSEIEFSPDGKILVTMDLAGNIRVWRR